jgi:multidrug efflux pump subunit AcrA (membrane-fusion protein)
MTNKRITELTALDGDDVADNDVLAIVDVSDTTMAASGTTKKITVAELVTDSALNNKFWPNSSTALTGANLANTDRLAVLDVGTPDVPKYIEADELAQGSQFSSRYQPQANDAIWLGAGLFGAAAGSPSLAAGSP